MNVFVTAITFSEKKKDGGKASLKILQEHCPDAA